MDDDGVTLELPATATAPRAARRGIVDGLELRGTLAASAALLVSEAVTNSVLHAGLACDGMVHVSGRRHGDRVCIEVCDEGAGLRSPSPAGEREGGFGLGLIEHLSERWGVTSDGHTRIWFEIAG